HTLAKAALGYGYGATGNKNKAQSILREFEELFRQHQTSPYHIAMIHAGLGDKDQAFAWLEEAYRERSRPLVTGMKVNPVWAGIRSDSRFGDLLKRMRLPQ